MIERYIRHIEAEKRLSPLTVRNYRRDLARFVAWCEMCCTPPILPFDPQQIEEMHLREWLLHRVQHVERGKKRELSHNALNRELSTLKGFFSFLHEQGILHKNPARHLKRLKPPTRLPAFLPESRLQQLLETCNESSQTQEFETVRDALLIELFYGCGIRLAELIAINRDDFRDDFRSLRIVGKGDKERIIPIVEPLRKNISDYLRLIEGQNICKNEKKALILSKKGERISRTTVYRIIRRILGEQGVQGKRSPHVLRHTFATHLLNSGADMREIQELMGHSSLRATQVYTHNHIAQLQEIYRRAHPREQVPEE